MHRLPRRLPEALVALGLALGVGAVVAILLTRHEGRREARPPESTSTQTRTTSAPTTTVTTTAPPSPPETPVGLQATGVSSFAAQLVWRTAVATVGHVAIGTPDLGPTRWLPASPAATSHTVLVRDLAFPVVYRAWVTSVGPDGHQEQAVVDFTTPPPTGAVTAGTRGGTIVVNGSPWVPLMVYGACSSSYPSLLDDGITLFAANPCGGFEQQLAELGGRALSAGLIGEDDSAAGDGIVGGFFPDEADGLGVDGARLPAATHPGLRLLTLSNHVYSGASPPPGGRGVYPGLVARSDVIGFDLYPLQGWCARNRLVEVYAAQRELVALAKGRPTFQWIEAAGMNCPTDASVAVTPETVRAESWLALAGGARGLGFFPAAWTGDIGGVIRRVRDEVAALVPALAQPIQPVTIEPADTAVRAAAWTTGGAVYIAAVNAGTAAADVKLRFPALGNRTVNAIGENRQVQSADGALADHLDPLQVHVYVAGP